MPLLLMMAVFVVCRAMAGTSEMAAALYSLLVLIPYYILLYLCRNLVGRRIQISIIERPLQATHLSTGTLMSVSLHSDALQCPDRPHPAQADDRTTRTHNPISKLV